MFWVGQNLAIWWVQCTMCWTKGNSITAVVRACFFMKWIYSNELWWLVLIKYHNISSCYDKSPRLLQRYYQNIFNLSWSHNTLCWLAWSHNMSCLLVVKPYYVMLTCREAIICHVEFITNPILINSYCDMSVVIKWFQNALL
jgi:hypothetical protein